MIWYFIDSGAHSGAYNMDLDVALTGACSEDVAIVRFYRWQPYCISLGMYQKPDAIDREHAQQDGLQIVNRPTGGRAVLHAEELTYSVVVHTGFDWTPQNIYRDLNLALKNGLELYDPALCSADLEHVQPDFRQAYQQNSGIACFATTAKNELKIDHRKLIGSAQRKIGNKILQHGSILCGPFHLKIARYLMLDDSEKSQMQTDLADKTIDIATVTGKAVDYSRLTKCMKKGFEVHFKMEFAKDTLDRFMGII